MDAKFNGMRDMTPEAFLAIAQEALQAAKSAPDDLRLVVSAVALTDMLAAHIFYADECAHRATHRMKASDDDTGFREKLAELSDNFRILRDLAKAQKHVKLSRPNNSGRRVVDGAEQVTGRTVGAFNSSAFNELSFNEARLAEYQVVLNDGSIINVLYVVEHAQDFLRNYINAAA